jgi:hypothetical protein
MDSELVAKKGKIRKRLRGKGIFILTIYKQNWPQKAAGVGGRGLPVRRRAGILS